jgi:hypothetical protein
MKVPLKPRTAEETSAHLRRRWRSDPASFIHDTMVDPETGKPFELLPAETEFFKHAFKTDRKGRLLYPEQIFAAPKKSGKTGFATAYR